MDLPVPVSQSEHRPLFVVANMVNLTSQIEEFLDAGANAISADVQFSKVRGHEFHHYYIIWSIKYYQRTNYDSNEIYLKYSKSAISYFYNVIICSFSSDYFIDKLSEKFG